MTMYDAEPHLQLALEAAHMAIWDSSIVNGQVAQGEVIWSPQGAQLLGLEERHQTQNFHQFLACVHPDDSQFVLQTLQEGALHCGKYALEYRVIWPDASLHWLAAQAQVFCDDHGEPRRTLGIIWDITDRKFEALATARQKELAEVTLRSIGDGVITTDAAGRTQFLNRIAEQLTGWTNEAALGMDIDRVFRLVDEKSGVPIENVALQCLRLKKNIAMSGHSQLMTHFGKRIAVENSAAPIWSNDCEVLGTVVVFRDISHEKKLMHQLSWHAAHDALTGLINRREFEVQVASALASARQDGHRHALLYLDLDQFKIVNDTCGHHAGDVLLQLLSRMLQLQMRESDILARLGGDELGVLLPHCPLEKAISLAGEIRQSIRDFRFTWEKRNFELGVSIGLVEISENSKSMSELLIAADQACYMAKEQGRNRVHLYHAADAMLAQRHGEMLWVSRLNEAFEQEHFRLYAQPIVSLNNISHTHEEVLIRITNSNGGLILPGAFIPAAERYDLMASIDRWVIKTLCRHIRREQDAWLRRNALDDDPQPERVRYSINLSGVSLNDEALHDYILEQFELHAIVAQQICFEITETAVISNLPKAQTFIHKVKQLGCLFSLDDFGSGLSSFAYLKALPVDYLKIDGIFIRDIANNDVNRAMVKAINEVGHVMGIKTVAEFVEDDVTLDVVRSIGIDYAQGYAVGSLRALAHYQP